MQKMLFVLVLTLPTFLSAQIQTTQLDLVGGDWSVPHTVDLNQMNIQATKSFYGVAVFKEVVSANNKELLASVGVMIEDYIGKNAYYVTIKNEISKAFLEQYNVVALSQVPAQLKLDPQIQNPFNYPSHAIAEGHIKLNLILFQSAPAEKVNKIVIRYNGQLIRFNPSASTLRIQVPVNNVLELAEESAVQFIEPIDEPGQPENYKARNAHRIGGLTMPFTGLNNELDGEGVSVMLQDDGIVGPHIDYAGRIGAQYTTINNGDHGDHVGGTIMGAGNLDPLAVGMAPGATMYVYDAAGQGYPGFDSIANHYTKHEIKITSTSYSNGQNAGYTSFARELDIQTEQMPALLHVFSAGNAGTANGGWYNVTGGHKVGKNVLTVANLTYLDEVNRSSSRGPSRDGRIKPEISAIGTQVWSTTDVNDYTFKTGTSMSCPGVSGTMAVLYQAYKVKHSNNYPDAILMKAIACNTADDLGNKGPDFKYGYGRINARKAFKVIQDQSHFDGTLSNGNSDTVQITIPSNKRLAKIMLAWNDVRGAANSNSPLVNNLDLKLIDPSNQVKLPYVLNISSTNTLDNPATNGVDNINNMEQIELLNMPSGQYQVVIQGKSIPQGPQKYHVVYYLEDEGIELEYPVGGESFVPGEQEVIRWSTPMASSPFVLEYSLDSGMTWNTITGSVSANSRFYEWRIPNTFTSKAMVRVTESGNSATSNTFTISPQPSGINITKICPDSMELRWTGVNGATAYNIYTMGQKYMEIVGTQAASPYIFSGPSYNPSVEMHFALDAVTADGTKSRRTKSILKVPGFLNCPLNADVGMVDFVQGTGTIVDCGTANSSKTVEVTIENNESAQFNALDMYMQINGGTVIKETYNGVIGSGQRINYTFTQKANYSAGSNNIKVWMDDPNDHNRWNDTLNATIEVYESTITKPSCYSYTFEKETNCSTANDCGFTTCTLSDGWINAKNGAEDDIDWRVDAAGTNTNSTGPIVDHTLGNGLGKYIYLEASGSCNFQEAALISPCIDLTNATAPKLSFWYNMNGQNMGSLHVDIYQGGKWTNDITAAESGNKGNRWLNKIVDLTAYKGSEVRIRFRGITGNGFRSDMALDDIEFSDKPNSSFSYVHKGNGLIEFTTTTPGANKWYWLFSNGNTDTTANPTQQFNVNETPFAYLRVETPCGSDSVEIELDFEAEGVIESGLRLGFDVYPNPAKNNVTVSWDSGISVVKSISIVDLNGRVVQSSIPEKETQQTELDVSTLSPGVYAIQVENLEGKQIKKLVIE